ncbi:MAG: 1,4-alpha-glucan branching protein GlgB [Desulfohalobiaceae bacterium]|nr:1,4-alpha-glucan branching protein GlgB [Desulfohalobiaceae bacterium]
MTQTVHYDVSRFQELDIYLFKQGNHFQLYDKLGSHLMTREGQAGTYFAVWAPNAEYVSVFGTMNHWDPEAHPLQDRGDHSGIWEGFIPGVEQGALYKYHIRSSQAGYRVDKTDPFAKHVHSPMEMESVVWDLEYEWEDREWMQKRGLKDWSAQPMSVYEVHPGSWQRVPEEGGRFLNYRELAHGLGDYVRDSGFTHVELMPVMEHPFYGSWGYQCLGYFAPTSRYGSPQDFMYLVDHLHRMGIGVILDWVPSHFPGNESGLVYFDGTHLFEHQDPRQGFHPEWTSYIFNFGRNEIRSFLISSGLFWLEKYHADGLRVDAVASMLYLDYGREGDNWIPNKYGGRENLEAIEFIRSLNQAVHEAHPDVQTIAEESTSWPAVTQPVYAGGLGFSMKWNMGWMHDTLEYMSEAPVHRKYHHNILTFSLWYAHTERFLLPLSHDEVVYGKGSLLQKMPGDEWQKRANLRLLMGYMFTYPGKKLLFMGAEFGQPQEWYHEQSLDWHLLDNGNHRGLYRWLKEMNLLYRHEPALYEADFSTDGFQWIDFSDQDQSVISYLRKGSSSSDIFAVALNYTPVPRSNYRLGMPAPGKWKEVLNSDGVEYGGSGQGNLGGVRTSPVPMHGFYQSVVVTLPPLGCVIFKSEGNGP